MRILGVDIGGTKTSVCIADERGDMRASRRIPTLAEQGPEDGIRRTVDLCRQLMDECEVRPDGIDAIGVSAPGPVSLKRQMMLCPPNMLAWRNVPLVRMFSDALGRPVFMNNDANACVLAEHLFGSCKGQPDMVYLTMSTGLGAGVISNGRLVQGTEDLGGEVGHHVLDAQGPPCPCGQRGCWEIYCGGMNMANRLRERIVRESIRTAILERAGGDPAKIDFRVFLEAVRGNDAFALEAWHEYVERLAQGVGTVIMFFNPAVIIMGTIAIHAGDFLLEPLRAALPRFAWGPSVESCRILPSALGTRIGDLSAVAVALVGLTGSDVSGKF
jgi:glucokinase